MADTVAQFDGFVAKYIGDGVLAYFGYPQAHEDDPERAVRAGLALVEAVPKLTTDAAVLLQVRIGIGAILSARAQLRNRPSSVRPRTLPLGSKLWRSRARW